MSTPAKPQPVTVQRSKNKVRAATQDAAFRAGAKAVEREVFPHIQARLDSAREEMFKRGLAIGALIGMAVGAGAGVLACYLMGVQ